MEIRQVFRQDHVGSGAGGFEWIAAVLFLTWPSSTGVAVDGHGAPADDAASWRELPDGELLIPPAEVTDVLVDPLLELLPTHEMTWASFESLLKRVAREIQGLRTVL
jgi:hypothetical protein